MEHSVEAYLKRLSPEKVARLLEELQKEETPPFYMTPEMLEILHSKNDAGNE